MVYDTDQKASNVTALHAEKAQLQTEQVSTGKNLDALIKDVERRIQQAQTGAVVTNSEGQ